MESRRIKLTKRIIKTAFIELLHKKSLEQITVTELCSAADVNRSTFYDHYSDFNMLLREIESDFLKQMPFLNETLTKKDTLTEFISFTRYVQENKDAYIILVKNGMLYDEIFRRTLNQSIQNGETREDNMVYAKLAIAYAVSGAMNLITYWLTDISHCTSKEIAILIAKLSEADASCVLT